MKKILLNTIKFLISFLLIVFILRKIGLEKIVTSCKSLDFKFYLFSFSIMSIANIIGVYRWLLLTKINISGKLSFLYLFKLTLIGFFFNLVLPTSIGGDAYKGYALGKHTNKLGAGLASVLVDRIIGLISILIIGILSIIIGFRHIPNKEIILWILLIFICIIICGIIIFNKNIAKKVIKILPLFILNKVKEKLKKIYELFHIFKAYPWQLLYSVFLSFIFQFLNIWGMYIISIGLNSKISIFYFFLFIPLIYIIQMLPISIAGIGIRETSYVIFFSQAGMDNSIALLISLLSFSVYVVWGIVGGIIFAFSKTLQKS